MGNDRSTFAGDLFAFLRPFVGGVFFLLPLPFFPFFGAIWLNEDPQEHTERNLKRHTNAHSLPSPMVMHAAAARGSDAEDRVMHRDRGGCHAHEAYRLKSFVCRNSR